MNDSFGKSHTSSSWSCTNDGSTDVWTYNQGVILGGLCDLYMANQAREPQLLEAAEQIADALMQTPYVEIKLEQSQIGGNTTKAMPFVTARISAGGPAQSGPKRRFRIQNWVYFQGTDNKLWRVKHDGSQQSQIGRNTTASMPFVVPHGNDDWVYFQGTDNKLWRVKHDGSQQSQIAGNTTSSPPHVMSLGGEDWVHFRGTDNKLWRVKYDGGQQTQIGSNTTSSSPFITADGWVYFQGTDNKLWEAHLAFGPSISGVNAQGILTEFNDSDLQASIDTRQFKGVFMRNLAYLYKFRPNARYREFILKNATSALGSMNAANQFGGDWSKRCDGADFVRQTAAIDLLNAANTVLPVAD